MGDSKSSKTLIDIAHVYFKGHFCESDVISHISEIELCEPSQCKCINCLNNIESVKVKYAHVDKTIMSHFVKLVENRQCI